MQKDYFDYSGIYESPAGGYFNPATRHTDDEPDYDWGNNFDDLDSSDWEQHYSRCEPECDWDVYYESLQEI